VSTSDWLPGVIAGAVTGVGSSIVTTFFGPGAQARAAEKGLRYEARRKAIADARALIEEYEGVAKAKSDFVKDRRFQTIQPSLKRSVRNRYANVIPAARSIGPGAYQDLRGELRRLEQKWKLV
jgi:hypothetical protein